MTAKTNDEGSIKKGKMDYDIMLRFDLFIRKSK